MDIINMGFIKVPNLPENSVTLALVDGRIPAETEKRLGALGIKTIKTKPHPGLYDAVSCHPDMMFHHVYGNLAVYAPGTDDTTLSLLEEAGFRLVRGESILSPEYPADVAFNVARVGQYYFHNLKYTDPELKRQLHRAGIEPVHVAQGYTKCSVCVLDDNLIITADPGIAESAGKKNIGVLKIESDQGIVLPGLNCGFIGGCTGLVDRKKLAVYGDIARLKQYEIIKRFAEQNGFEIISLCEGNPVDYGSLIPLKTI